MKGKRISEIIALIQFQNISVQFFCNHMRLQRHNFIERNECFFNRKFFETLFHNSFMVKVSQRCIVKDLTKSFTIFELYICICASVCNAGNGLKFNLFSIHFQRCSDTVSKVTFFDAIPLHIFSPLHRYNYHDFLRFEYSFSIRKNKF